MKKVLITGANSYIGTSVENWLEKDSEIYDVDVLDMKNDKWLKYDFTKYDTVLHVAGIAHADTGHATQETKTLYYKVNTEMAVNTAKKSKESGVKQFILMSSMIIYGESGGIGTSKVINKDTIPSPSNFYGNSKWLADKQVGSLNDNNFKVVIIRAPMIYGKGSKGNFGSLSKMAKILPVFPNMINERSMLYISNLCEFIKLMIDNEEHGLFFPQNKEYVKTSDLVSMICLACNKRIWITSILNPFIYLLGKMPGKAGKLINKAFGSMVYAKEISEYKCPYRMYDLKDSICETEQKK